MLKKLLIAQTLLDKAFETAKDEQQVIDKNFSNPFDIIDLTRNFISFLSKLWLAVWVSLFLWGWIRMLLSIGDENKMKKARDDLILVWIGLAITLGSLGILYLIQSIPRWISL